MVVGREVSASQPRINGVDPRSTSVLCEPSRDLPGCPGLVGLEPSAKERRERVHSGTSTRRIGSVLKPNKWGEEMDSTNDRAWSTLRRLRQARGWSQAELGRRVCLHHTAM